METQTNQGHGSGNWIAFLFGAVFNMMAYVENASAISYASHAIVGGIIFLFFKIVGDLLSPIMRKLGLQMRRWIEDNLL